MRILLLSVCVCSILAGASIASAAEPAQTTVAATSVQPTPAALNTAAAIPPAVQCVGAEGVVYFDLGATRLNTDSKGALQGLASARRAECTTKITITGYTDSRGSIKRNRQLAAQRAAAVQQQLVSMGVPQEEVLIGAAGEMDPQSATEDKLNRRVTIVLAASPRAPLAQPAASTTP